MLDWDDLRFFLAVVRAGSQNAATVALGADQTTVGRRLRGLEAHLGTKLVTRTARGIVVTSAGEAIRAAAEDVEKVTLAVERAGRRLDDRVAGALTLATTDALACGIVLPALAGLRAAHPELLVRVTTAPRTVDLSRGEADVALRTVKPKAPELVVRKAGVVVHGLYASAASLAVRGTPRRNRGLAGHDVLAMAPDIVPGQRERIVGVPLRGAQVALTANNVVSLLHAAVLGVGIAPLPTFLAARERSLVRIWPEREDAQDAWLVVHRELRRAARVRVVMDVISKRFRT